MMVPNYAQVNTVKNAIWKYHQLCSKTLTRMNLALFIVRVVAVIPTAVQSLSTADLLPYGDTKLKHGLGIESPMIILNHNFTYLGTLYDKVLINNRGLIQLEGLIQKTLISPYYAYVNTSIGGDVWYRTTTNSSDLTLLNSHIRNSSPFYTEFTAAWGLVATWDEVAFQGVGTTVDKGRNNTYQAALVSNANGTETFAVFSYVKLESRDSPYAMFYNGFTPFYKLPGSGTVDALKLARYSNTGTGRWIYRISTVIESDVSCNASCPHLLQCTGDNNPGVCYCPATPQFSVDIQCHENPTWTAKGIMQYAVLKNQHGSRDEAKSLCAGYSATLPVPNNEDENNHLVNLSTASFYLGMKLDNATWRWDSGSTVDWFNWAVWKGQSKTSCEECAIMVNEYRNTSVGHTPDSWSDFVCNDTLAVVCQKACPDGTYGDRCSNICHCAGGTGGTCHMKHGKCVDGCQPGWSGGDCQVACSPGTFGPGCLKQCHCAGPTPNCDPHNGSCGDNCELGWKGADCQLRDCASHLYCGNQTCVEHNTTFACDCSQGYQWSQGTQECMDVDECDPSRDVCGIHMCENTDGSYICHCNDSFYNVNPQLCLEDIKNGPDEFESKLPFFPGPIVPKVFSQSISSIVVIFLVVNFALLTRTIARAIYRFITTKPADDAISMYASDSTITGISSEFAKWEDMLSDWFSTKSSPSMSSQFTEDVQVAESEIGNNVQRQGTQRPRGPQQSKGPQQSRGNRESEMPSELVTVDKLPRFTSKSTVSSYWTPLAPSDVQSDVSSDIAPTHVISTSTVDDSSMRQQYAEYMASRQN